MFFVGGAGPARSAPTVRPSAQPFPPPPRSTDGAHINPGGPSGPRGCGQPLHQEVTLSQAKGAAQTPPPRRPASQPGPALTGIVPQFVTKGTVECNSAEGRLEILVYGSLKDNLMSGLPGGI